MGVLLALKRCDGHKIYGQLSLTLLVIIKLPQKCISTDAEQVAVQRCFAAFCAAASSHAEGDVKREMSENY